jgi:O-antigen/teichoic acid export membrane protein
MIDIQNLKRLASTTTFRQSVITVASTILNGILATGFYLYVAYLLGSTEYGLFILVTATVAIMTVVFDFGNDRGLVKFMSKYSPSEKKGQQILKAALLTKLLSGLFFIVLFYFFASPIAQVVFNQPEMAKYLPYTAMAFASQLLFYFATYFFQAREQFVWWGIMYVGANFVRLILTLFAAALGIMNTQMAISLFALTPFMFFLLGMTRIGWGFLKQKIDKSTFIEIFSFNKWVTGFSAVSTVSSRLDTYVTSHYSKLSDVGIYGLASQAIIIMPNLVSALGAVTSPKFSRFRNPAENKNYLDKSLLFFGGISFLSGIVLLPLGLLFMYISGPEYLSGFVPFVILVLSQAIFLGLAPLRDSLLYFHSKPSFFFWAGIAHGAITLITGFLLLPRYGLVGASLSNLAGQVVLNGATLWYYQKVRIK